MFVAQAYAVKLNSNTAEKAQSQSLRYLDLNEVLEEWCESLAKCIVSGERPAVHFAQQFDSLLAKMVPLVKGKTSIAAPLWLLADTLLFNVSSNIERVKRIAEDAMIESTGSGEFEPAKMNASLEALNGRINDLIERLMNSAPLRELLLVFSKESSMKMVELSMLVQTCDYLLERYVVRANNFVEARGAIEHLLEEPIQPQHSDIEACNQLIFSNHVSKIAGAIRTGNHFPRNLHFSLFRLFEAHWTPGKKERKLFVGCALTSQEAMSCLLEGILCGSTEEVPFSENHSQSAEFGLIEDYLVFRFLPVFHQFCSTFNKLKPHPSEEHFFILNHEKLLMIVSFLRSQAATKFGNFLHRLRKILSARRSEEEVSELIKLLLLNRFLLNPQLKAAYDKSHFNPKDYPVVANRVKSLFFPKKLQGESLLQLSSNVHAAYIKLISAYDSSAEHKNYLYLNDRLLHLDYLQLSPAIKRIRAATDRLQPSIRSPPLHVSFQQQSLSTVQKQNHIADNPSSVKRLLKDISIHTDRLNGSVQSEHNATENQEKAQPSSVSEIDEMGIIEYLTALRLQQSQRHKNRQHYMDSLRRGRQQFFSEFDRVSEHLNSQIFEVGQSRTCYEMYEQLNRE